MSNNYKQIRCACCKDEFVFHTFIELQITIHHWYERPRGCCEGDFWHTKEWSFLCKKSGIKNRILFNDSRREHDFYYKYILKIRNPIMEYKDSWQPLLVIEKFVNNYDIDNNPIYWELK